MSAFNWPSFIIFSIVMLGTPGPATISIFHSSIHYSFKQSLPYLLGVVSGFLWNWSIVVLGMSTLLENKILYRSLQYLMLAYILMLTYKIARANHVNNISLHSGIFNHVTFFHTAVLLGVHPDHRCGQHHHSLDRTVFVGIPANTSQGCLCIQNGTSP